MNHRSYFTSEEILDDVWSNHSLFQEDENPEESDDESYVLDFDSLDGEYGNIWRLFFVPTEEKEMVTYTTNNETASYIYNKLMEYGLPSNVAAALTIHAGAESGYQYDRKNPNSTAYGLGQWIEASANKLCSDINRQLNKNYTNIRLLSLDELILGLKIWYWDNSLYQKHFASENDSTKELVSKFAKWGLGPALFTGYTGSDGYRYTSSDEDVFKWFKKYHPYTKDKSWSEHINNRIKRALWSPNESE